MAFRGHTLDGPKTLGIRMRCGVSLVYRGAHLHQGVVRGNLCPVHLRERRGEAGAELPALHQGGHRIRP